MSSRDAAIATWRGAKLAFRRARAGLWRFKRSPAQRDRASMIATFAAIGLFALGSVDAIVTGGADFGRADFGPSAAYATEYQPADIVMSQPAPVTAVDEADADRLKTAAAEVIDYSFATEVLLGGPEIVVGERMIVIDPAAMELASAL